MKHSAFFIAGFCLLTGPNLHARPLFTEEVNTIGKKAFEASVSAGIRNDEFGTPVIKYNTGTIPFSARIGFTRTFDAGFYLTYIGQRLETGNASYTGSSNGMFSPFFKVSPWPYLGFQGIWHTKNSEQGAQNLPVARGHDFESIMLLKLPTAWPVNFNVGYLSKGYYRTKLGISNDHAYKVEPGNIFEAKGALEVPIAFNISLLGELAYYNSEEDRIEGVAVPESASEAMDALAGITWAYAGWNIGAGAAFGLLDEQYTSFDLERGAGDVMYKMTVSYRLVARRPNQ